MDNLFKLKEHNTTVKTEFIAGLTSFFAAVYIIMVNASILSDGGIPMEPLIIATVLSSLVGCLLVAFMSNTPLVIMPGMGVNALFTYTIIKTMGLTFFEALASVTIAGLLFVAIAITPLSKLLTDAIPDSLKEAISVGIGLFITFLGVQKSGILVPDASTFVKLGDLTDPTVIVFLITMVITLILFVMNVPGSFLIGIITGTIISIFFGIISLPTTYFSLPDFKAYNDIFFKISFSGITDISFWIATFSLTLILVFQGIGLLHGQVGGLLKRPEKTEKALTALAISTLTCGLLGTSPTVSTVEGTAGIAAGGRTGLTAIFASLMLLLSLFLIPVIAIIPNAAIAPVLIILGGLMIQSINQIDFKNFSESFPSFLIISLIPLTFNIVDGIAFGFITYPICKIASKKFKDVSTTMYVVSLIFLLYFILRIP